ncbi:type VI secretion system baseplate subunit TssF, partial [Enterobacter hormaechei]|uniref:type VI secretion system baseplate subunit TssF n=1 Tax=Enterobacter hormaechei TaxID=158836 RepID=UPI001F0A9D99
SEIERFEQGYLVRGVQVDVTLDSHGFTGRGDICLFGEMLALYEWTDSEMNRRRLEAIIDVKHSEIERFEQGYLVRGVQVDVTLDSHGFTGRGDI